MGLGCRHACARDRGGECPIPSLLTFTRHALGTPQTACDRRPPVLHAPPVWRPHRNRRWNGSIILATTSATFASAIAKASVGHATCAVGCSAGSGAGPLCTAQWTHASRTATRQDVLSCPNSMASLRERAFFPLGRPCVRHDKFDCAALRQADLSSHTPLAWGTLLT